MVQGRQGLRVLGPDPQKLVDANPFLALFLGKELKICVKRIRPRTSSPVFPEGERRTGHSWNSESTHIGPIRHGLGPCVRRCFWDAETPLLEGGSSSREAFAFGAHSQRPARDQHRGFRQLAGLFAGKPGFQENAQRSGVSMESVAGGAAGERAVGESAIW